MSRTTTTSVITMVLAAVFLVAAPAMAEVIASVDRAFVELNESFIYKLTVDSRIDAEPNVAELDKDFFVGSRSYITNTTILNGDVQKIITWSYVLMAKREGKLTIPPVKIGA